MPAREPEPNFDVTSALTVERIDALHNTANCVDEVGSHLAASADLGHRSVGLVMQFAAETITGATLCATENALYASVSLHRQLIEITHLLAYFAHDVGSAARWAKGRGTTREFRPATLRAAIGVTPGEYSDHCELAGHPRPAGWIFLPGQRFFEGELIPVRSRITGDIVIAHIKDLVLSDGLRHTHDGFHAAFGAAAELGAMDESSRTAFAHQQLEIDTWASQDPLAAISSATDMLSDGFDNGPTSSADADGRKRPT